MANQAVRSIDHQEIREWVEARGGSPAIVADTRGEDGAVLRVDFGEQDEALEPVRWDEFFRMFDENDLAFLYQEEGADGQSYFCKFVARSELSDDGLDDLGDLD